MSAMPWPERVVKLESTRGAYAYLVRGAVGDDAGAATGAVLIDTGLPGRARRILDEIAALGGETVQHIVVTHGDVDHVGNLAEIAAATGASVFVPAGDRGYIMDGRPRPGLKRLVGAIVRTRPPASAEDLRGGDRVGPLVAIDSPGHTPGHIAYAGPGFVAVGDALTIREGRPVPSRGVMAWDAQMARASADKLLAGYRGWVLPAHQEPIFYDGQGRAAGR